MAEIKRISPTDARERVRAGTALFVCAYESEDLCRRNWLEGALNLKELEGRAASLDKNQEIIFYCA